MRFFFILLLLTSRGAAQIPSDSFLDLTWEAGPNGSTVIRIHRLEYTSTGFAWLESWPSSITDVSDPLFVHPTTGQVWGIRGARLNRPELVEFHLGATVTLTGRSIPLPVNSITSTPYDWGFNEQGQLEMLANGIFLVTVDFERGVSWEQPLSFLGTIYESAAGGRPAIVGAFYQGDWVIASLDENKQVQTVFFREPGALSQNPPFNVHQELITTHGGRTFAFKTWPNSIGRAHMQEIDYASGVLRDAPVLYVLRAFGGFYDPSREQLIVTGSFGISNHNAGAIDLATNRLVGTFDFGPSNGAWARYPWLPANHVAATPRLPTAGSPIQARLALGGNPGDLGVIAFLGATLGGVFQPGLETFVAAGPMDSMGLLKWSFPYDPAVHFAMGSGDSLTFVGFRFDGTNLTGTPTVDVMWQ